MKHTIGIVDDHPLFLKSLSLMLQSFNNFTVTIQADSDLQLQERSAAMLAFFISVVNY